MHTPVKTRTPVNKIHVPLWAVIAVPVAALVVGAIIGAARDGSGGERLLRSSDAEGRGLHSFGRGSGRRPGL